MQTMKTINHFPPGQFASRSGEFTYYMQQSRPILDVSGWRCCLDVEDAWQAASKQATLSSEPQTRSTLHCGHRGSARRPPWIHCGWKRCPQLTVATFCPRVKSYWHIAHLAYALSSSCCLPSGGYSPTGSCRRRTAIKVRTRLYMCWRRRAISPSSNEPNKIHSRMMKIPNGDKVSFCTILMGSISILRESNK